jgi:tripartite-type tricarboxylate transporter receptor subunit TctC
MRIHSFVSSVVAMALALCAVAALAQGDYPAKPVRLVVPFAPGGGTDVMARAIGQKLTEAFGRTIIVDNRAGANGFIGSEHVARQPPDGYTLLLSIATTHAAAQHLYQKMPFDPFRDFAPVTQVALSPIVMLVHPSFPAHTLRQFIDFARARPQQVSYGSFGHGSTAHLYGELINLTAGTKLAHVPYKGSGPALQDLLGGQIPAAFLDIAGPKGHIAAGKVRAVAVTGPQRWQALPDVATFRESGYPGFEVVGWFGLFAPTGTPRPIIDRLAREVTRIVKLPDVAARLVDLGTEPVGSTPEAFAAAWKTDADRWGDIIRRAGIRID